MVERAQNLSSIRTSLLKELGSTARLHFVNTRLILTVGVDLNGAEPERSQIENAVIALRKMGFLQDQEAQHG